MLSFRTTSDQAGPQAPHSLRQIQAQIILHRHLLKSLLPSSLRTSWLMEKFGHLHIFFEELNACQNKFIKHEKSQPYLAILSLELEWWLKCREESISLCECLSQSQNVRKYQDEYYCMPQARNFA